MYIYIPSLVDLPPPVPPCKLKCSEIFPTYQKLAKMWKLDSIFYWWGCGETGSHIYWWWDFQLLMPLVEGSLTESVKIKFLWHINPTSENLWYIYIRCICTYTHVICTSTFKVFHCNIVLRLKATQMPIDQRLVKKIMVYPFYEYFAMIKKQKDLCTPIERATRCIIK